MTAPIATRKLVYPSSAHVEYFDVPEWVESSLRTEFSELEVVVSRSREQYQRHLEDCEILVSWTVKREDFLKCNKLLWIHSPMAGVTQLLYPELVQGPVILTNATTVHAIPVAEQALALMFSLSRRIPACVRWQDQRHWGQDESWKTGHIPSELDGKVLVIVGFGAIGRELASRAKALKMRVVTLKRDPSRGTELADKSYSTDQLDEVLGEADYLVLAAPETPETRGMIGKTELQKMKPTACLINVARGTLVKTDALIHALENGVIAGAGLDVTDPEPLPHEHPLWAAPNVLITLHLAGTSDRFWQRQIDLLAENLRRYLTDKPLLNVIDKSRGY